MKNIRSRLLPIKPASRHVGRVVIESMELANLIVLVSLFVFNRHKCLMLALILAFVFSLLVKTRL